MKNVKRYLPTIIIVVAILAISIYSVVSSIAQKPTITEGEFPFSITYELDGETVTVKEVYKARYVKNGGYADTKTRIYEGEISGNEEGNTVYTLKKEENGRIELWTQFYPDYLMGDSEYDYFDDKPFEPRIYYYDSNEIEYEDEETLSAHGVKLVDFEYPTPIKNSFVFSHISYFSSAVVIPSLMISLIALLVTIIFVKKDKETKYKAVAIISIVLNVIICLTMLPLATILGLFIDINGGGPEFYRQTTYFMPALFVLCITASVALRRKGYSVISLITGLIGPAIFAIDLIVNILI